MDHEDQHDREQSSEVGAGTAASNVVASMDEPTPAIAPLVPGIRVE
jgi:hypothetical protein